MEGIINQGIEFEEAKQIVKTVIWSIALYYVGSW